MTGLLAATFKKMIDAGLLLGLLLCLATAGQAQADLRGDARVFRAASAISGLHSAENASSIVETSELSEQAGSDTELSDGDDRTLSWISSKLIVPAYAARGLPPSRAPPGGGAASPFRARAPPRL